MSENQGNWPRHPSVQGETVLYGAPPFDAPWIDPPPSVPTVNPFPISKPVEWVPPKDYDSKFAELLDELRTLRQAHEAQRSERVILAKIVKVLRPDLAESEIIGFGFDKLPAMIADLGEQLANESARALTAEADREKAEESDRERGAILNRVAFELYENDTLIYVPDDLPSDVRALREDRAAKVEALAKSQAALNEARRGVESPRCARIAPPRSRLSRSPRPR